MLSTGNSRDATKQTWQYRNLSLGPAQHIASHGVAYTLWNFYVDKNFRGGRNYNIKS